MNQFNDRNATEEELVVSKFVPTVVYVREDSLLHTRLCIYNYFSELFPSDRSGAQVSIWFFDQTGATLARRLIPIPYRGQLQFDLKLLDFEFEGTAGVALIPNTIPEFTHKGVGTGFYVYYYDDAGHADFSHEWDAMRFKPIKAEPWTCVIRPLLVPETDLIVMNSYYGCDQSQGTANWSARIRNKHGKVVCEKAMPPLPPRSSVRLPISKIFPDVLDLAKAHQTIAIEAVGTNIMGPFTYVKAPSGDFNIHHFC